MPGTLCKTRGWILALGMLAVPIAFAEAQDAPADLEMTATRLFEESSGHVKRMQKVYEVHKQLLQDAESTGLVVAIEAIRKDIQATRELLELGKQLLAELETELALSNPENANLKIKDYESYVQVKEIRTLGDQAENLYKSDKRFLESLQKPTELRVTRVEESEEE